MISAPHFYWRFLVTRAFSESLEYVHAEKGVIVLAILGFIVTGFFIRLIQGKEKFREHLIGNGLIAFCGALASWALVFLWFLVFTVPSEINTESQQVSAPRISPPSLPTGWDRKFSTGTRVEKPSDNFEEPFHVQEELPDEITIMLGSPRIKRIIPLSALKSGKVYPLLSVDGFSPLSFYMKNQTFYVDATLRDSSGKVAVEITKNTFRKLRPPEWDRNASGNAIEIVDATNTPVFQMINHRKGVIEIRGLFLSGQGSVIDMRPPGVSRIFKYPAWQYPKQYADQFNP